MKKLFITLSLLISAIVCFGQTYPIVPRSNSSVTVQDSRFTAQYNLFVPKYADTTAANLQRGNDSCSAVIFTYDVMSLWVRACSPKRWQMIGGPLTVDTTRTVRLSGAGTILSPLAANAVISTQSGNILQVFPDGVYATTQTQGQNFRIGGDVIWQTGLTYIVTAATYGINGVTYTSPQTTITLSNADPSLARFDGFVLTTSGTAISLTGTPDANPVNPSYNPTTQLPLTFVQVTAAMTEPAYCRDSIYYISNGQTWTGVVSNTGRINTTSTSNPYSVPQDVEFTLAQNSDQYRVTKSSTISFATYAVLTFQIRSKATWPTNSRVNIRAYSGLTPLGINVALGDGIFGFNSSITNAYQLIAIPIPNLGSGLATADNILFTVSTTSNNTIGFYLDDIQLLGCDGVPVPVTGRFWSQGGDTWGTMGVIGTNDNFPVQAVVNNTNHTRLVQGGAIWLQGATPGFSMLTGTFAASDYYRFRSGTTIIDNTAGDYSTKFTGNIISSWDKNNNFIWRDSLANFRMQLTRPGNLLLGTNADNASTIFNVTSTTKASHPFPSMTTAQKNAIVSPQTADLVYDATLTNFYYYDGAVWQPFGANVTATNGLNKTGNAIGLGGSALTANTSILTSAFSLTVNSSNATQTLAVNNTGGGYGVYSITNTNQAFRGESTSGNGGDFTSVNAAGLNASSDNSYGMQAFSQAASSLSAGRFHKTSAALNTVLPALDIERERTSGTAANGIGTSIDFYIRTTVLFPISNRIISRWTDATSATRTSEFSITGVNSATTGTILTIAGNGAMTLGAAYQGSGAGYLAVSNTGAVTWSAGSGGGGGDVVKVGTPVNNQLGVWTGNGTIEGDANLTFASSTLNIGVAGAATGILTVSGVTSGTVTIQPASAAGTYTLTLPTDDGTSNQVLTTNGSGVLSWTSQGIGTVSTVSVVTNQGVSGVVANATTTPAITLSLGALTGVTSLNGLVVTANTGTITTGTWNGTAIGATFGGTAQTTYATGDVLYASASNVLSKRTIGSNGQVFTVVAGVPQWSTPGSGGSVTSVGITPPTEGISVSGSPITTSGNITLTLNGDLAALEGLGTTGFAVRSGAATWVTVSTINAASQISGTLQVGNGGTGNTSYTSGQILIGNGGGSLTKGTIGGTANQINVTNGSGTITLSMAFNPTEQTLTDGATTTWNVTNGGNSVWTNNGSGRTLAFSNVVAGYSYTLRHIQGAGGSHTVTTWTNVRWANGTVPTLTTTAGATDAITFYAITTNTFIGYFTPNVQ